jgi:lysophospholipase L1-like esterase
LEAAAVKYSALSLALALAAGTIALETTPAEAATIYWAFGDSITRGEGLGFKLDPVPGDDCLTNPYPVVKCGYHWRLRDALTSAGLSNDVRNRGVAGEETLDGISRIDATGEPLATDRCADPGAGDVLLLMEGTNDVSSAVSTATIKANLGAMLDLATSKCVHSAVASTIRRLKAGTPVGQSLASKEGDPLHVPTTDLATEIIALANDKARAYIDIWTPLCPNQPCYGANASPPVTKYWGRLAPAEPGHLSYVGYDAMAPIFESVILANPLPGAATLTGPTGDVTTDTPPFCWSEHPNSDWYFLEVNGGASYGRWHPQEEVFPGGPCVFAPVSGLADGAHTWRVRTRNLRGVGAWSGSSSFTVWNNPPGLATSVVPNNGDFYSSSPFTPTYSWNAATKAMDYRLQVNNGAAVDVLYDAGAVCSGSSCSATPPTGLGAGSYTWRVRAENPKGNGSWSTVRSFMISCPAPAINNLTGSTENGTKIIDACTEIIAGAMGPYTVASPNGDVTFHAGAKIALHNGFTVEQSAEFTAIVDQ